MKTNMRDNIDIVVNLIIVAMLIIMLGISFSVDTKFVMSEDMSKPIYRGDEKSNNVSIMFNVYWGNEYIDGILDVLERYGVHTTFFVGGSWVEKNQEFLLKIHEKGHEIANHGYFHKDQNKLTYDGNINEIEPNNLLIEKIIGIKPKLFAPPSGAFNANTTKAVSDLGMYTIMWSRDTIDWRDKNTDLIVKRATKDVKGGELILAHPTKNTLEALPTILKYYENNGLKCVIVSENIKISL